MAYTSIGRNCCSRASFSLTMLERVRSCDHVHAGTEPYKIEADIRGLQAVTLFSSAFHCCLNDYPRS